MLLDERRARSRDYDWTNEIHPTFNVRISTTQHSALFCFWLAEFELRLRFVDLWVQGMNEEPNSVVDDEESDDDDDDDDDDDEKLAIEVVREAEEGPVIVKPIRVIGEEKTRVDREGGEMSAGELEERNPDRESRDEEDHYRMKSSFQFATDDDGEEMTLTQRHLWLWRLIKWVRDAAKERVHSYYWRHLAAWTVLTLLFSGPLYATGKGRIPYIDSLFYTASALTGTGLATRDVSDENIGTQVLLFLLMTVSGPVVESLIPPVYRLLLFRRQ